jgi:hemerythrin-like domain-containing protein
MPNIDHTPEGLRAMLTRDHRELDQLFDALSNAVHADARDDTIRLWAAFDDDLCRHMALEEKYILPVLRQEDAVEAAQLSREHDELRAKLADLGIGVDLHQMRAETVSDFIAQLRRHAQREEALAYRWAQANLPADAQQKIRTGLSAGSALRQRLIAIGRKARARVTSGERS